MERSLRPLLAGAWLAAAAACGTAERAATPAVSSAALVAPLNTAVGQMGRYDFDAAVTTLAPLVTAHPASGEAAFDLAVALINRQRAGDAEAAEQQLRPLTGHPIVGTRARYALGLLLLYQGRDDEAFGLLRGVAEATRDDPFPAYFAGQARLATAPAEALSWFTAARTLDPLLRSASYGEFQALQRTGRSADAAAALTRFQALDADPRARMAEFKYTRMGPLAEAMVVEAPPAEAPRPAGPLFEREVVRHSPSGVVPVSASLSVVDLDGDGTLDVFAAGTGVGTAANTVLLRRGETWQTAASHPLAAVPDVRAALWGDLDNDDLVDVVFVRGRGRSTFWRQTAAGRWLDVTASSRAATPGVDAVDGALVDADHDGDLDVVLANGSGPLALLNNNGDGSFRDIADEAGLAADRRPATGLVIADLDADRDHDLIVLKAAPPHLVFRNARVWRYEPVPASALSAAPIDTALAADLDANGRPEIYTTSARGLERWPLAADGSASAAVLAPLVHDRAQPARLALADVDGDGAFDLVVGGTGWEAYAVPASGQATRLAEAGTTVAHWTLASFDAARGPSIVGLTAAGLVEWMPGSGRHGYLAIATTGRSSMSDQRRSNVSGIGTRVAVRTGTRWTAFDTVRLQSGGGQSLQPVAIGLGGAPRADLVTLVWPDGVLQSELHLDGGRVHRLEETQRQLSSCPVLFAYDGTAMRFVTDILGVGGIGFLERPGVYSAPLPREHVLLPAGALAATDGQYRLAIGEPMEEVTYLDRVGLVAYDLPPGWRMTLDERKAITGAAPTGSPIFYRDEVLPTKATNDRGADVTALVITADRKAAPPGAPDPRFIGRAAAHTLELTFERALDAGPGRPVLVIDGWVEYPYAQTVFAAWQAGATFAAPTLEARDRDGHWHVVAAEFGYPAGMPRQMALPLPPLPSGTTSLRLTTTQEIFWDRVAVVGAEALPGAVIHQLPLAHAVLRESGFARRTTGPQRTPDYDYAHRAPLWDTRHPRGWYTAFGDVAPLVAPADDAVAIIGPGEEVAVTFDAPTTPLGAGWTRQLVLEARGWCKDMDLYTKDGDTVGPLPGRASPARTRLHAAFHTRYEAGQ